jgi:hypothetical protein
MSLGRVPDQGRNGAVSVIALAERGALFDPGPCMYMEKLAGKCHAARALPKLGEVADSCHESPLPTALWRFLCQKTRSDGRVGCLKTVG